jgi:hypothetical protein
MCDLFLKSRSNLDLPQLRFLALKTHMKTGINQFETKKSLYCASNFKAFENYFKMNTKALHQRKLESEVVNTTQLK